MNKNSVKHMQGINFSHLTLSEKTEIKNLDHATPYLVISQPSSSRIQTCMRKFNPSMYVKYKWFSGCAERNTVRPSQLSYSNTSPSPTIRKSHVPPPVYSLNTFC
jgi:hypothetical protein